MQVATSVPCNTDETIDDGDSGGGGGTTGTTGTPGGPGSSSGTPPDGDNDTSTNNDSNEDEMADAYPINMPTDKIQAWIDYIDQLDDLDTKRIEQLDYIATHNGRSGIEFKSYIEDLLATPNISVGEVKDINYIVNEYWEELLGRLIMANFLPVAQTAKPFITLALYETGAGILFQAVKGLLAVKWGVQLSKIGINTSTLTNVINRVKSSMTFFNSNSSMTLNIGGRNLFGLQGSRGVYRFNDVTNIEAKAIFEDMVAGRELKTIVNVEGKLVKELRWRENGVDQFVKFRNFSTTNQGEMTIEVLLKDFAHLRGGKAIELKFYL